MNRRNFLRGLIAAPAIVAIDRIMPVRLWRPEPLSGTYSFRLPISWDRMEPLPPEALAEAWKQMVHDLRSLPSILPDIMDEPVIRVGPGPVRISGGRS